jgi:hypothetical protein
MMKQYIIALITTSLLYHSVVHAEQQYAFTGKIVYVPLENGFYGITNDHGERFVASNLPDLFKQDGLSVTLQAIDAENTFNLQMWGRAIELQDIAVTTCTRLP